MADLHVARWVLIGLCVGLAPPAASAQNGQTNALGIKRGPIGNSVPADRPGFSDSTALVPQGHYEAEGGYRYNGNHGGGSTYIFGSNAELRTGISPNIELRFGYNGYEFNAPGNDGSLNTNIGAKIRVHNATRYTPTVAVLPQLTLPTGDGEVASDVVEPGVHFIFAKSLTRRFALGGNLNFAGRQESDNDYHFETAVSVAGAYKLNNQLSGYAEYYSIIPSGPDHTRDVINGGIAFLTSPRNQLDAFIGTGLNNAAPDVFVGFGIAHLW